LPGLGTARLPRVGDRHEFRHSRNALPPRARVGFADAAPGRHGAREPTQLMPASGCGFGGGAPGRSSHNRRLRLGTGALAGAGWPIASAGGGR
jgi:hypothetical protein